MIFSFGERSSDKYEDLDKVLRNIDIFQSAYSHITNCGEYEAKAKEESEEGLPYDIDAITCSTLTIDSPAMEDSEMMPIILCYGTKGYPNVMSGNAEGYSEDADNSYGPLRVVTETSSQSSMKFCVKIVVKIPGSGEIVL